MPEQHWNFHPDAFTIPNQLRIHAWLQEAYKAFNDAKKPLADRAITKVVSQKPVDAEQARQMIRPEDFARATSGDSKGEWALVRRVSRDPVIAALVSKAAATSSAIACLAKEGFGSDAYALCRVLLENMIVLEWLLPKDVAARELRIDTFILHMEAFLVRFEKVTLAEHEKRGTTPDPDFGTTERTRELSSEVFEDKWMYWAWMDDGKGKKTLVKLKQMAADVGFEDFYTRDYFTMSAFIHSAPASVFEHSGGPTETILSDKVFAIRPELFGPRTTFGSHALALSNAYMIQILDLIDRTFEFGLADFPHMLRVLLTIDPKEWPEIPTA